MLGTDLHSNLLQLLLHLSSYFFNFFESFLLLLLAPSSLLLTAFSRPIVVGGTTCRGV